MTYPVQTTGLVSIFKYKKNHWTRMSMHSYIQVKIFFYIEIIILWLSIFWTFQSGMLEKGSNKFAQCFPRIYFYGVLPQYHFLQPPWKHGSSFSNPISNRIEQSESKYKSIAFNSGWTYIKLCIRHRYIETD